MEGDGGFDFLGMSQAGSSAVGGRFSQAPSSYGRGTGQFGGSGQVVDLNSQVAAAGNEPYLSEYGAFLQSSSALPPLHPLQGPVALLKCPHWFWEKA